MIDWIEHHPGLAAWFQALGSLVAVGAAALIAVWQAGQARKSENAAAAQRLRATREAAGLIVATVSKFVHAFSSTAGAPAFLASLPHVRITDSALEVYRDTLATIPLAALQDGVLCERVLVIQSQLCAILDMIENLRAYFKRGGIAQDEIAARVDFIANAGSSIEQAAGEFQQRLPLLYPAD